MRVVICVATDLSNSGCSKCVLHNFIFPVVNVPVLSSTTQVTLANVSNAPPLFNVMPALVTLLRADKNATGTPMDKGHGVAAINTDRIISQF